MCTSPKIILNPAFVYSGYDYDTIDMPNRVFKFHMRYGSSIPSELYPEFNYVTHDNISQFNAVSSSGDILPLYIEVPCGHCDSCVVAKQMDMYSRLQLEQYAHEKLGYPCSYFVTLTYSNTFLPSDGVSKSDVQKFFKRLRINLSRHLNYKKKLRYALFSEYGKEHGRAHYHFILFGFNPLNVYHSFYELENMIRKSWKFGFVHVKPCHSNSFKYLSKYLLKNKNVPDGKNPNFYLTSNSDGGIGCKALLCPEFLEKMFHSTCLQTQILLDGCVKSITIPHNVINYYFRKCSKFYRTKYARTVYSFLNLHRSISAAIHSSRGSHWENVQGRCFFELVEKIVNRNSLFSDVNTDDLYSDLNSKLPNFIVYNFPFLYDIFAFGNFESPRKYSSVLDPTFYDDVITYLYLYIDLKNFHPDLQLIAENDLYLQKIIRYPYVSNSDKDMCHDLRAYDHSCCVSSFCNRSSVDNQ